MSYLESGHTFKIHLPKIYCFVLVIVLLVCQHKVSKQNLIIILSSYMGVECQTSLNLRDDFTYHQLKSL
jgi:hypothetical protein